MTNPDNIVRVRARNGGRASVYEANGWAQAYTSGLLEGNGVTQNTSADMNVLVGGSMAKPDVILAENPSGYKIALDIVGKQPIAITTPASNSRISAIVAYTDDLALVSTEDTVTGSPASCGLIVVNGTASASPSEPTDNQIRTAITADGATGSQASYCVIATVLVSSDTTIITDSLITVKKVSLTGTNIVKANNVDFTAYSTTREIVCGTWIDGRTIYKKTINIGTLPNSSTKNVAHNISNISRTIKLEGFARRSSDSVIFPVPFASSTGASACITVTTDNTNITIGTGTDRSNMTECYITLYYTKSS